MGRASAILLLASLPAHAFASGSIDVRVEISEQIVPVGEVITVEVTATARKSGTIEIKVPRIKGLVELRRQQNEKTSMSWML